MTVHLANSDPLIASVLGRSRSLFERDIAANTEQLEDAIGGRRLLVVGASGSIGSAFVNQVARFRPRALHLVDINEDTLVELIRDLRSSSLPLPEELRTVCVDFGSDGFRRFAANAGPYDALANFAAMKHVRSERDVYSLMRMVEVNVEGLKRCLDEVDGLGAARVFSVSTDKSVRPANLMGATKNLMEKVLFSQPDGRTCTSARFANVAFSAGSLLDGFEHRFAKRQPLAAPSDIERYFMSHEEAGELCLIGCFVGDNRSVVFPKLTADQDLRSLTDVAAAFLRHHGYEPHLCESEEEARAGSAPPGTWPCYFAPSDTTGEKPAEEFHGVDEEVDEDSFEAIRVVRSPHVDPAVPEAFLADIDRIRTSEAWTKDAAVDAIRRAVPEIVHDELGHDLDQKM